MGFNESDVRLSHPSLMSAQLIIMRCLTPLPLEPLNADFVCLNCSLLRPSVWEHREADKRELCVKLCWERVASAHFSFMFHAAHLQLLHVVNFVPLIMWFVTVPSPVHLCWYLWLWFLFCRDWPHHPAQCLLFLILTARLSSFHSPFTTATWGHQMSSLSLFLLKVSHS